MTGYEPRWRDAKRCSHSNDEVCRTCDFDSYYALTYPTCPWRSERLEDLGMTAAAPVSGVAARAKGEGL